MKIEDIMTTRVVSADIDDTLDKIRDVFKHVKFHHILILENQKLVGVISDRDLLKEFSPYLDTDYATKRELSALSKRAHQVMTRKLVTITPEKRIQVAARIFVKEGISCLPVVDKEGQVVGIVTWRDIMQTVYKPELVNKLCGQE